MIFPFSWFFHKFVQKSKISHFSAQDAFCSLHNFFAQKRLALLGLQIAQFDFIFPLFMNNLCIFDLRKSCRCRRQKKRDDSQIDIDCASKANVKMTVKRFKEKEKNKMNLLTMKNENG